jgi:hypothetical protein
MRRSWTPEPSRPAWIRPTSPTRTQAPHPLLGLIGVIALAGGGVDLTLHARALGIDPRSLRRHVTESTPSVCRG